MKARKNKDMNRNLIVVLTVVVLVLGLAGCGGGNTPKGALERYMDAMVEHDLDAAISLVNWEGQTYYPDMRVTEMAAIRSFIKAEDEYYKHEDSYGPFGFMKDMREGLERMIVDKETETTADVICYVDKKSTSTIHMEKVGGNWKVKLGSYEWLWRMEGYFDETSPFCDDILKFFAAKGNTAAQERVAALERGGTAIEAGGTEMSGGATSPREVAEKYFKAMVELDMGALYDLYEKSSNGVTSMTRQQYIDRFVADPEKAILGKNMQQQGRTARILDVVDSGDGNAVVKVTTKSEDGNDCDGMVKVVRHGSKWFLSSEN